MAENEAGPQAEEQLGNEEPQGGEGEQQGGGEQPGQDGQQPGKAEQNAEQAEGGEGENQPEGEGAAPAGPPQPPPDPHPYVPPSPRIVNCICSDGVVVGVPANYIHCSRLFQGMFMSMGVSEESDEGWEYFADGVQVGDISSTLMLKIADWCEKHAALPEPVREYLWNGEIKRFEFTDYESNFLDVPVQPDLVELLIASNYLDIPSLFTYACQKGAMTMEDKTCEQVREEWGFPDDLTDEEKEEIRRTNPWITPAEPQEERIVE